MSSNDSESMVNDYLRRLDLALSAVAGPRRQRLVEEIAQHVAERRREISEESPTALLQLLDRIGRPEDIAAAALEQDDEQSPRLSSSETEKSGLHEALAIALLLFGGYLLIIGWLIGVVLLWSSPAWRTRDKVLGTLIFPGGLLWPFYLLAFAALVTTSEDSLQVWGALTLLTILTIGPILVAVHLYRARNIRVRIVSFGSSERRRSGSDGTSAVP